MRHGGFVWRWRLQAIGLGLSVVLDVGFVSSFGCTIRRLRRLTQIERNFGFVWRRRVRRDQSGKDQWAFDAGKLTAEG